MSQRSGDRVARLARPSRRPERKVRAPLASALVDFETEQSAGSVLVRYGGTIAALALATAVLWPVRQTIGLLNIGMVFLIVVVGATVLAGRWAGIFASVLGFAMFNYFLVPPYLTFVVEDLVNILALFVFLGVSSLISWLLAQGREKAREAERRAQDVSRLYELSQAIIGARHIDEVLPTIADKVADVFEVRACWILLPSDGQRLAVRAQAPRDARQPTREEMALAEWAFRHGSDVGRAPAADDRRWTMDDGAGPSSIVHRLSSDNKRAAFTPLRSGRATIGVLGIADKVGQQSFTTAERIVLATFADQAAVALERLSLLREAERAEMLARTDELKSALVSAVSHDLRTPLASIIASVTSLLEPGMNWDEETRRDFLQGIYDEARRLDRLVGNLLDMSRIEAGELRPEQEWYSIGEVIESVVQRLYAERTEPRTADHPLSVDVAEDSPLVLLDFTQIDQVITNLIENALKHTPPGTPVHVHALAAGDHIEVSVSDSGPGVLPEHLPHLFSKFYRVEGRKQVKGMGLGLAISKGLVEAHGGRIWAENQPGGGLKVTFTLPIAREEEVRGQRSVHSLGADR